MAVSLVGCGGADLDSLVDSAIADGQKMVQAANAGDENAFLAALAAHVNAMAKVKEKLQLVSGPEMQQDPEMQKVGEKLMVVGQAFNNPMVITMMDKIAQGPKAAQLNTIQAQMANIMMN